MASDVVNGSLYNIYVYGECALYTIKLPSFLSYAPYLAFVCSTSAHSALTNACHRYCQINEHTCFEQIDRPRPVPPRLLGCFISSSLPCTYSLNRLRNPRWAIPTPVETQVGGWVGGCVGVHMVKLALASISKQGLINRAKRVPVSMTSKTSQCRLTSCCWVLPWMGPGLDTTDAQPGGSSSSMSASILPLLALPHMLGDCEPARMLGCRRGCTKVSE